MQTTLKSSLLVGIQFLCIGLLLILGLLPFSVSELGLLLIGLAIGVSAIISMKLNNFRISPEPKASARFVNSGLYSYIRHPMYTAVLLCCLALAMNANTSYGYLIWVVLLSNLIVKLTYEEKLLRTQFKQYTVYASRTKRLIPYVW